MDKRKLIAGLAVLLLIAGVLVALFAPSGLLNPGVVKETIDTPIATFTHTARVAPDSNLPILGYVLAGVGGVGLVVAFAMKPQA
jgi:hypothetical protein